MAYTNPTITDFQNYFVRDFPYGTDIATTITTQDIGNAMQLVNVNINPCLFDNQPNYTLGYLYMTAHFLVQNIRASSQGINGQFNFLQAGKGVGAVSESFAIPPRVLNSPLWSMYTKTNYGMMFLQLVVPRLIGQVFSIQGTTRA